MEFDIDVSGTDIFSKDYTLCIASKDGKIIQGFKMNPEIINKLRSKYNQELYKYKKSSKGNINFKIRIYSIIIYIILKELKLKQILLNICKDFFGKEKQIKDNLYYLLKEILEIEIQNISFGKLNNSYADKYAYLMRKDNKNKMQTYTHIKLEEIEVFLNK